MKVSELEELGFTKFQHGLELHLNHELLLEKWEGEHFITLCTQNDENQTSTELTNVNTIEKVKQLIELLKDE